MLRRLIALLAPALLLTLLLPATVRAQDAPLHTVEAGETLSEIAKRYGTNTATLMQLNNLANADVVQVGVALRLPTERTSSDVADVAAQPQQDRTEAALAQPVTLDSVQVPRPNRFVQADGAFDYITEPGDTLTSVAARFRIGPAVLVDLNRISPAQQLAPGQRLLIPYSPFGGGLERSHVVQAGQSLMGIAATYDTTLEALIDRNSIANPSLIAPGMELIVPPPPPVERMSLFPVDRQGIQRPLILPTMDEKWIDVDLSEQLVTAYEGTEPVASFVVSTGKAGSPTVTGTFRIWIKTAIQDMWGGERAAGDYYYLPGVKWVQYFHEDYGFHTAYWHNNFGTPTSRGCINMREDDAKWLFDWAGPVWDSSGEGWQESTDGNLGTLVVVRE
jgi:LysM repeat protein